MTYELIQLAPGSYDLLRGGAVMASVVRTGHRSKGTYWTAELLEDLPLHQRPAPFTEIEHRFDTLEQICTWLGNPVVKGLYRNGALAYRA